jgi:transmembrane sensor
MGMSYPTAREEQAAYWYLKLQESQVSAEEIQAALAWQSDPENRAAFERVEAFWRAWPLEVPVSAATESPKRISSSTLWQAAAAVLAIVSVSLWAVMSTRQQTSNSVVREYATSVGQIRTVWLDDGTEVILGGATSIRTSFAAGIRRVAMTNGEALFLVAKDEHRPFIVDMPNGSARALGTTFNVHHGPDDATIAVLEGAVRVSPPSWRNGDAAELNPGTQVSLSTDGMLGRVREVNAQEIASWHSGRMVFVDRTLRSVIADLNRYSSKPVTLAAADAADMRVSGNINLDQIEAWLRALGPAFGVDLVDNEHGLVLVSRVGPPSLPE